jgi:hypothetical protein
MNPRISLLCHKLIRHPWSLKIHEATRTSPLLTIWFFVNYGKGYTKIVCRPLWNSFSVGNDVNTDRETNFINLEVFSLQCLLDIARMPAYTVAEPALGDSGHLLSPNREHEKIADSTYYCNHRYTNYSLHLFLQKAPTSHVIGLRWLPVDCWSPRVSGDVALHIHVSSTNNVK